MYSLWEKMRRKPKYHNNIVPLKHQLEMASFTMSMNLPSSQNGEDNIDDVIALRIVLDIDQLDGESDDDFASRGAKLCNHALALARKLPKWSGNPAAQSDRKCGPKRPGVQDTL